MRFVALDVWTRRESALHRRDARAKILATLILLIAIAKGSLEISALVLAIGLAAGRLPVPAVLLRACVVLPFSLSLMVAAALAGRPEQALQATLRSYVSAICVLLLAGTTPLPLLLGGLRRLGAPAFLLEVIEFIYRYLLLIGEQARRMALAATTRGARRSFAAVAGSVGVLFARSYDRADSVHRAMLARGYDGAFRSAEPASFRIADVVLIAAAAIPFLWHR